MPSTYHTFIGRLGAQTDVFHTAEFSRRGSGGGAPSVPGGSGGGGPAPQRKFRGGLWGGGSPPSKIYGQLIGQNVSRTAKKRRKYEIYFPSQVLKPKINWLSKDAN